MDRGTDLQMDRRIDGYMGGETEEQMVGRIGGQID
jgi:hypothetical protein